MKTLEYHNNGNWIDKFLNAWPFCLDTNSIKPILEIEYGANKTTSTTPDFSNLSLRVGKDCTNTSLFRNGLFYLRLVSPFGLFVHFRWCAFCRRAFMQTGFGGKLNGRFTMGGYWLIFWPVLSYLFGWHWWYLAFLFMIRIQSDQSAAEGVHGRNSGQAVGWSEGNH